MRHLSVKQKNLIKKECHTNKSIQFYEDLTTDFQDNLDQINCFENLPSAVNRFIQDIRFNSMMSRVE